MELVIDETLAATVLRAWSPLDLMSIAMARYPRLAHLRIGDDAVYLVTHPDTVAEALLRNGASTDELSLPDLTRALDGSLASCSGAEHLARRRLMQPDFSKVAVDAHREQIESFVESWIAAWTPDSVVDVREEMTSLFVAAFAVSMLGLDISTDVRVVQAAFGSKSLRAVGYQGAASEDWDALDIIVDRIIRAANASSSGTGIVSTLLREQVEGRLTETQVAASIKGLFVGSLTAGTMLSWFWYLMATHPDERRNLESAIDAGDDVRTQALISAALFEAMRIYPPTWILKRQASESIEVDGYRIPQGAPIWAPVHALHHDNRFWSNPDRFEPSRWLDSAGIFNPRAPGQPLGAWLPFGIGRRQCIGDELTMTASQILVKAVASRWRLDMVEPQGVEPEAGTLLRPKGGKLPMSFERREVG